MNLFISITVLVLKCRNLSLRAVIWCVVGTADDDLMPDDFVVDVFEEFLDDSHSTLLGFVELCNLLQ